ncbi:MULTISPECIES: cell wall elongation regulator TseB-like domain-containing protein [Bacillaceae]|uniref:cell wall elongation regulator TseB-like domain-containing protein n=1 Tax=Bacillaceae TaxID=186817 RepID=UPI001E359BFA|nr:MULTISPECIES: DUF5590 domain-containing protein [Bacillaceae]MCE4047241.1 DUF5590 domain-containing protein [Bacillus sp. Au-Bac7]MCM3031387.1 DUF5590 domain-containing protein [Niallia sp. MER 6]
MKKWIWSFVGLAVVVLGIVIYTYTTAHQPVSKARETAEKIAKEEAGLVSMDNFSLYNGNDSYYVVEGKNKDKEDIVVWIEEKSHAVTVKNKKDGLTKQQVINKLSSERELSSIDTVRLGMLEGLPVWEVYAHTDDDLINYFYFDYETGELHRNIENI